MRRGQKKLVRFASCLALLAGVGQGAFCADEVANPYKAIVDRNVFDLKAPKIAETAPPPPPATPPPNVKLTGLTSIFGKPKALFMLTKAPGSGKGAPAPGSNGEESVIMNVGERQGTLELLEIDMKEGTAKVKNDGTEVVLTLPNPSSGGGGAPGGPARGPGGAPVFPGGGPGNGQPPKMPTFIPQPQIPGGLPGQIPAAASGVSPSGISGGATGFGNGAAGSDLGSLLTRDMRTPQAQQQPADTATIEEKMLMLEANRIQYANNPNHSLAPLPPPAAGMAELLGQGTSSQNGTTPAGPAGPVPDFISRFRNSQTPFPGLPTPGGH